MVGKIRVIGDKHNRWFDVDMGEVQYSVSMQQIPITLNNRYPTSLPYQREIDPIEFNVDDGLFKFCVEWIINQDYNVFGRKDIVFTNSTKEYVLHGCMITDCGKHFGSNEITLIIEHITVNKNI